MLASLLFILWPRSVCSSFFFFFNDTATTEIYTLSLHDALPISPGKTVAEFNEISGARIPFVHSLPLVAVRVAGWERSEEHTSELQSPCNLVCRLLLEKKKLSQLSVRAAVPATLTLCAYFLVVGR